MSMKHENDKSLWKKFKKLISFFGVIFTFTIAIASRSPDLVWNKQDKNKRWQPWVKISGHKEKLYKFVFFLCRGFICMFLFVWASVYDFM